MQCTIIVGNETDRISFFSHFKEEHKIKEYNILSFHEKLKLAEAREIKKFLSTKQSANEKKLVILSSEASSDAQNSLLKILEEIPENAYFIWSVENVEIILPTIQSRCQIISFTNIPPIDSDKYTHSLLQLVDKSFKNESLYIILKLAEEMASSKDEIALFMYAVRKALFAQLTETDNDESLKTLYILLEKFNHYFSYISTNNINKRILAEHILLSTLQ